MSEKCQEWTDKGIMKMPLKCGRELKTLAEIAAGKCRYHIAADRRAETQRQQRERDANRRERNYTELSRIRDDINEIVRTDGAVLPVPHVPTQYRLTFSPADAEKLLKLLRQLMKESSIRDFHLRLGEGRKA